MSERLLSGHSRLDGVLGGGLPKDAINMLIGLPGTGKTILAQQYLFANATLERPALYLATVSEPFDKILRYGQSLRFFDPEAVGRSVFYEDLGLALNERGLAGVLEQVTALIKERRPGIIVIDSFKALSAYAEAAEFRRFLHDFAGHLSAFPASSFWIGEYGEEEIAVARNSQSQTQSSASPQRERPSARRVPSASSSCGEANSLPASTPTASRRTGSTSSRGSPTRST